MTNASIDSRVNQYPMGPKLRNWLGIEDSSYAGSTNLTPSLEDLEAFEAALLAKMEDDDIANGDSLTDLIEELVGMNLPLLAIRLADAYLNRFLHDDFRSQLHLGNACMLVGEFNRAEACFVAAQRLVPAEPAPYVNLVQIYGQEGQYAAALKWCLAGLDADHNFLRLWELLAWIFQQQDFASASDKIQSEVKSRNSWAGSSLLADLMQPSDRDPDPNIKVAALDRFYHEGLRDFDFLVEYTAALGLAGHYERIPTILWQAEKQSSSALPWQLYLHGIQAFLGLSRDEQALEWVEKVKKMNGLPPQARSQLEALEQEARGQVH